MRYSHKLTVELNLYNPLLSLNSGIAARWEIELVKFITPPTDAVPDIEAFEPSDFLDWEQAIVNNFDRAQVLLVTDPFLIRLLEPKSGQTVHDRIEQLTLTHSNKLTWEILGLTIPPETTNGYKVVVLGNANEATVTGMAKLLLRQYTGLTSVVIDDGVFNVTASAGDLWLPPESVTAPDDGTTNPAPGDTPPVDDGGTDS